MIDSAKESWERRKISSGQEYEAISDMKSRGMQDIRDSDLEHLKKLGLTVKETEKLGSLQRTVTSEHVDWGDEAMVERVKGGICEVLAPVDAFEGK